MKTAAVEKYYSVAETCLLLGFSDKWVRERVKAGDFDPPESEPEAAAVVMIEKDIRIPASGINRFLGRHALRGANQVIAGAGVFARSEGELKRKLTAVRGTVCRRLDSSGKEDER
jgi:hypothetical protein